MAGQKLSARQKMINMMYLVLTALLALNVSAEILSSFETLKHSLERSVGSIGEQNVMLATSIKKAIEEDEKHQDDRKTYIKPLVDETLGQTESMMQELQRISTELHKIGGMDPVTKELKHMDERDANYRFWMGKDDQANERRGNGEAQKLKQKLDAYIDWANSIFARYDTSHSGTPQFQYIALDPAKDPSVPSGEHADKPWEYYTFGGKPVVADMAMVEKFKVDVKNIESQVLNFLKILAGGVVYKVDKLVAVSSPKSMIVPAGGYFETTLSVGMSSTSLRPEFSGAGISADENGYTATMKIPASAGVIGAGDGRGTQHYSAKIKVPRADGKYEELTYEGDFQVIKPVPLVTAKEVQILYKDCGNSVTVDVPALGDLYSPDFSRSTGGRIIPSRSNPKDVLLVPTARQFVLDIRSNTNGQKIEVGKLKYRVINPPKPRLAMFVGSREHNGYAPISRRQKIRIKAIPDADFKRSLPRDARYVVTKVTLKIQQGIVPPQLVDSKSGNIMSGISFNLNQGPIRSAQPGDKIIVEVEGFKRKNFQNKTTEVGLPIVETILTAPIK